MLNGDATDGFVTFNERSFRRLFINRQDYLIFDFSTILRSFLSLTYQRFIATLNLGPFERRVFGEVSARVNLGMFTIRCT